MVGSGVVALISVAEAFPSYCCSVSIKGKPQQGYYNISTTSHELYNDLHLLSICIVIVLRLNGVPDYYIT